MADNAHKVKETLKEVQRSREKVMDLIKEVRSMLNEPPERKYSPYRNEMLPQWTKISTKQ